ncbi:NAD(P)H-dependent oxidoreductase [Sutterella sp.]|uniref:NAD(P)H-dependent oxidoreductase n=1 Tax=Sutterella sp. TaxID=1981025 RepID=UPI0026E07EE4|nr:NAD(P)H-dependent oxidoreductase [Sutterella sp.]MDO5531659.1 NAD(P)H-dependent oxidoreductase [Sutterella sp.]
MTEKNVLIVSGHPSPDASFANRTILEAVAEALPAAEIDRLDRGYDVAAEQAKLEKADVIVLEFPLWWYSCPALMHGWFEEVLAFGFAYGSGGTKLKGKKLLLSFTSGSPEENYREGGPQNFSVEAFLPPFRQTAAMCSMEFAGYVYSGGYLPDPALAEALGTKAREHARRLVEKIESL